MDDLDDFSKWLILHRRNCPERVCRFQNYFFKLVYASLYREAFSEDIIEWLNIRDKKW